MSKKGGLGEGGTRGMKGKIANANRAFRFAYANFRLPSFFSRFFFFLKTMIATGDRML